MASVFSFLRLAQVAGGWILVAGIWKDSGGWIDNAAWID